MPEMPDQTPHAARPWPSEDDERFSPEERKELRELLRLRKDLDEIVKSKMITKGVINFIGEAAKYIVGLIGVVLAYRQLWGKS